MSEDLPKLPELPELTPDEPGLQAVPALANELPANRSADPPAAPVATSVFTPPAVSRNAGAGLPIWVILLLILSVIIVAALAIAFIFSRISSGPASDAQSVSIGKLSTFLSPPTIPADQYILQQNGSPLQSALPVGLSIAGNVYPVVAVMPEEGRWPIPNDTRTAVWVYGTVVNYVIGLPYTETTASELAALDSSARLTVTLSSGVSLVFGNPQTRRVAPNETAEVMAQQRPGLTLVLLSEQGSNRLIVQARYLPEESQTESDTQNLDTLNVEIVEFWTDDAPDDDQNQYFQIEFNITNNGTEPVDPAVFNMVLEDGNGRQWPEDPEATDNGYNGPLSGPLAPGESVEASAGYLVPQDLKPPLSWIFRADPTIPQTTARFPIAYQPPQPAPAQPYVELTNAFADSTRNVIVINGMIANDGEQPLYVTLEDVALSSSEGESELRASTPLLPWTINAGGEQRFELQFTWPDEVDAVLINVLGFTFQLEGF